MALDVLVIRWIVIQMMITSQDEEVNDYECSVSSAIVRTQVEEGGGVYFPVNQNMPSLLMSIKHIWYIGLIMFNKCHFGWDMHITVCL